MRKGRARLPVTETLPIEWASPAQQEAFVAGPGPLCLSGGWGSAKTYAACMKGLWLNDTYPKNRGLIFRKVGKEMRATTEATFRKLCPPSAYEHGGSWNQQQGVLTMNNQSQVLWLPLDDPAINHVINGLEINWFIGDQAEEIEEDIFSRLLGRLGRWDQALVPAPVQQAYERREGRPWPWVNPVTHRPLPPTYAMVTCNPDTDLHWLYNRFHPESPEWQEKWQHQAYRMIFFNSFDNKFLPEQNKQELRDLPPDLRRRYAFGLWGIPEGVIHTIAPESMLEFATSQEAETFLHHLLTTCTLHRTLDHGDSAPTCCAWWAVDQEGNAFGYREYYQPNKLVSYHREQITALSEGERYSSNFADPSIHHKTQQKYGGRWSVADEYQDTRHLPESTSLYWAPADNNELGTRNRLNEYLQVDPDRIHPVTKTRGSPRLFFLKRNEHYPQGLVNIIRETRAQRRLAATVFGGISSFTDERDPSIPDHGYDTLRYFVASRPGRASRTHAAASPRSFFAQRQRLAQSFARRLRA